VPQTVLITGASNGFGNDVAKTLATGERRVFATMRDIDGRHHHAATELQAKGIETLELDVTSTASVDAAFKALFDRTDGKLDVLINNAGIASAGLSETFTPEQVRAMFEVNVFGVQRVLRAALPQMRRNRSGLVINVGSILGRVTIPTKLYTAMQSPSDPGRADQYGAIATLPGAVAAGIKGIFEGADAPDPHDVATTIAKLIDMPAGQRPDRVVVGRAFGADVANAALQPLQGQMVSGLGLDHLATLKLA
jgi:hypothetical protein